MSCRCCGSFVGSLLAIGTLIAVGGAGYRVLNDGCPLCHEGDQAKVKLVSTSLDTPAADKSCCDAPAKSTDDRCCPFPSSTSCDQTKAVSAEPPSAEPPCCHGETKAADKVAASGK